MRIIYQMLINEDGSPDTRHPRDIELERLRAIYSAIRFAYCKYGTEIDPWVLECIKHYETDFVERPQWVMPGYVHAK